MLAARRLPGIRVDALPPPAAEVLPRMDIAVFVGFAATGPLHRPVAIVSPAHFRAVFGPDAPLAWDEQRGERVLAHLGAAVRAFFGNGGRRCWVIRVARTSALEAAREAEGESASLPVATCNRFAIPGVLEIAGGAADPAIAQARCEGSWSDSLSVATAIGQIGFSIDDFAASTSPGSELYSFRTQRKLKRGDVLELSTQALRSFAIVETVTNESDAGLATYAAQIRIGATFERVADLASPSAGAVGTGTIAGQDPMPAELVSVEFDAERADDTPRLKAHLATRDVPQVGHWLRWTDASASEILWISIDAVAQGESSSLAMSPESKVFEVTGRAWRELDAELPLELSGADRAYQLTIDMQVFAGDHNVARLDGVGLAPAHENSWWRHVTDETWYESLESAPAAGGNAQASATSIEVRFPLSAIVSEEDATLAWIPLGVEPLFAAQLGPLPTTGSALERDGLADFDASLFVDPTLGSTSAAELIARSDALRFTQETPRQLFGVHASLAIGTRGRFNEASLLAAPDAVHLGWRRRDPAVPFEPQPASPTPPAHWFTHRGGCTELVDASLEQPDFGAFLDCRTRRVETPELFGPSAVASTDDIALTWTDVEAGASYSLVEARQADFSDAREIYSGSQTQHTVDRPRDGIYYYQVTAFADGERSGGSNPIAVVVHRDEWRPIDAADYAAAGESQLLRVHRAMLRLGAASGELFCILTLPQHYRSADAVRYAGRLQAVQGVSESTEDFDAFAFNESRALSYGALYHPWLISNSVTPGGRQSAAPEQRQRIVPPDGVITGLHAARATQSGAWIAPANQECKDVVALTPSIDPSEWQALQDAAVNLIRDDARGFLTLSADTLSLDAEVRPINVRRLLILLRRLALRRGVSYVFEPNSPALRRAVQRGFNLLLTDLFNRGAFAGRTAEQSFRVVTDGTINSARDQDAGRFFVELRVAPSLPMRFLSVLLTQSGERLAVTEEL